MRHLHFLILSFCAAALSSCQHSLPNYLLTQGFQQGAVYLHAKDIDQLLKGNTLSEDERRYLSISKSVLEYAENKLLMDSKGAYQKYTKLDREAVTWVVVAAPRDEVRPFLFSYPIMGDLPYRGYFKKSSADEYARYLEDHENLDVYVRPVPAYSSTGWLPDPVLSTMFSNELDFVETLLHELVHLQFFLPGEAMFNEAFATWYAEKATIKYLTDNPSNLFNSKKALANYRQLLDRSATFAKLNKQVRELAKNAYASSELSLEQKRDSFFQKVRNLYAEAGFERVASGTWNNARIASMSTYFEMIPDIQKHFEKSRLSLNEYMLQVRKNPADTLTDIQ